MSPEVRQSLHLSNMEFDNTLPFLARIAAPSKEQGTSPY